MRRRAADITVRERLYQLVEDERGTLSSARVGLWCAVSLTTATLALDLWLTLTNAPARVPNTAYALLGSMLTAFVAWAAGPRIAQYLGPQVGAVASGLAGAARDAITKRRTDGADDGTEPTP